MDAVGRGVTGGPPSAEAEQLELLGWRPADDRPALATPEASPAVLATTFLGRLRTLGLRGIRRCTLTANRSTLVSFRADELRAQRALVDAPWPVLRAIVDFVNGRGARRRAARRVLAAFMPPAAAARPPRRRESPHPGDEPMVVRLRDAHRRLNRDRFDGVLRDVAIRVSRRMRSRLGHYSPGGADAAEIAIARRHIRRDGWTSVLETLVHEMVHQWQHETARPVAHDRDFRRKAREVGISSSARRPASATRPPGF